MDFFPEEVSTEDVDYVHGTSLAVNVRLTPQQERFVALFCYGFPAKQAARHAGLSAAKATELLESPEINAVIDQLREVYADEVRITRETITVLLLEAHRKAATASEEISAAKELGKLHGLYKSDEQRGTKITQNTLINGDVTVAGRKKIARMTTDQLIELAHLDEDTDE